MYLVKYGTLFYCTCEPMKSIEKHYMRDISKEMSCDVHLDLHLNR